MNRKNWIQAIALCGLAGAIASFVIPAFNPEMGRVRAQELYPEIEDSEYIDAQIDKIADRIFYERHPELRGRKIRPGERNLAREWQEIRQCDAVTDYFFYQRHPEMKGRKIESYETDLIEEWQAIRRRVDGCR